MAGSLRAGSLNRAALRAAAELAPDGVAVEILDLDGIPLFNADHERDHGFPPAVAALRESVAAADALLIATPEYNFSMSGVLKNALDWLSRGGAGSPLNDKPAAILGAGGRFGTLRAQLHLRETLLHNRVDLVASPQVMIDRASERFDERLRLTDERARSQVARLVAELAAKAGDRSAMEAPAAG
ncbi:MAG: NAD(P)H-dependent oxidoreductase [Actinobacteria bacterium]|nr:NAD(P)H-dependent oxidoreductase [Actinomycetota bacterium]